MLFNFRHHWGSGWRGCKNVLAIAAGVAAGLNFGVNAHAALITRGLAEIKKLGNKLGAKDETF